MKLPNNLKRLKDLPKQFYWMIAGGIFTIALVVWLSDWAIQVQQDWAILQQNPTDATKQKFDASLEIAKAIVGSVGTIATIGGGVVLFLNFRVANKNILLASQNLTLTESRLITDRFAKAVEQLGHADVHVRLGAIYSLERIANDSDQDYWPVMEILTAYVRERSAWTKEKAEAWEAQENPEIPSLAIDIQAIMTVLGRRKHSLGEREAHPLDLCATDLRGADLRNAQMKGTLLRDTHLEGANLTKVHLEDSDLSFAYLEVADLSESHLERATLSDAHLEGAILVKADLKKVTLVNAHLEEAKLYEAHLKGASLMGANLKNARLGYVHLEETKLMFAHLEKAELFAAHLEGANLSEANLIAADLEEAHLEGANLEGAKNLTSEQFAKAKTDRNTKYPNHIQSPWTSPP